MSKYKSSEKPCPLFSLIVIYRLTVSTDSSISVAEIRCLSDHQDQIRSLINVNGQSTNNQRDKRGRSHSDASQGGQPASDMHVSSLPQTGCLPAAPMQASWSCGMRLTGATWPMSTSCGRSHSLRRRPKSAWTLPIRVRCPFSTCAPTEKWRWQNGSINFSAREWLP